jgi:hypothetical protein
VHRTEAIRRRLVRSRRSVIKFISNGPDSKIALKRLSGPHSFEQDRDVENEHRVRVKESKRRNYFTGGLEISATYNRTAARHPHAVEDQLRPLPVAGEESMLRGSEARGERGWLRRVSDFLRQLPG